ncbi:DUF6221 family protein [Streptosporangium sp. NPDC000396]|uniref:DUF6221 family protein n=1 Tax=Streptosporangium sp. NPDC000396 TaxID=3366185 RepID=UPI003674EB18
MNEMLTWLRATIEGDLAAALRASNRLPGHSERRGAALGIEHDGAKPEEVTVWPTQAERWAAEPDSPAGGKVVVASRSARRREAAASDDPATLAHIAIHDPQDTVARCMAELAELNELKAMPHHGWDNRPPYGCPMVRPDVWADPVCTCGRDAFVNRMIGIKAYGYRHRPGWQEGWAR